MSHIIQKFGDWKKLNEDDLPGREKERGSKDNKIVAIPVDKSTLKLKVVNDADIIDGDGRLTVDGFDALLTWIKSQGEIISYYSTLNDLTSNIVVYTINRDTDRAQVVIFKIYNKNSLKMQDPSKPGINSQVRFVRSDELNQALNGVILNTKGVSNITAGGPGAKGVAGFTLPYPIASMLNSTDVRIIKFVILAYNKMLTEPTVAADPIMARVRAETGAKKLGTASQTFIKALSAGFAIPDNEYSNELEADEITQILVDKITNISGSGVITGFDVDTFLNVAKKSVADTGDIKVPEGGFREGMQNNTELKKFQELLAKKLSKPLANHGTYQAFKKAGAKGYLGNYGPLTSALVKLLKMIAENPKYPNSDGTVIEPDFVKLIQQINESASSSYIGLDGISLIVESTFNFASADAVSPVSVKNTAQVKDKAKDSVAADSFSKDAPLEHPSKPGWQYTTKNDIWYVRKGPTGTWGVLSNPESIKQMIQEYGKKGYYIKLNKTDAGKWEVVDTPLKKYRYSNKQWEVFINNSWVKEPDPSLLIEAYKIGGTIKSGKLNTDLIKGYAHTLFLAVNGLNTNEDEIYGVFKKIKSPSDFAALNIMFKKEPGVKGQSLAYWLRGDLTESEWEKVFKIIQTNKIFNDIEFIQIENTLLKSSNKLDGYRDAYKQLVSKAITQSK